MNQLVVLDFMGLRSVPSGVGPGLHPLDLFRKSHLQDPGDRTAQHSRQSRLQRTLVFAQACLQRCRPQGTAEQASPALFGRADTGDGIAHIRGPGIFAPSRDPERFWSVNTGDQESIHAPKPAPERFGDQEGIHAPKLVETCSIDPERFWRVNGGDQEGIHAPKPAPAGQQRFPGTQIIGRKPKREAVPSAAWLVEAVIRFRKSKTDSLLDVSFADGVLSLPAITVDDDTECEFLNLMAFERLHVGAGNEITSYVFFMDNML